MPHHCVYTNCHETLIVRSSTDAHDDDTLTQRSMEEIIGNSVDISTTLAKDFISSHSLS